LSKAFPQEECHALASDGRVRTELPETASNQAAKFSWDKCAEQTLNAYETAVKVS
jgi:hypothetical protein